MLDTPQVLQVLWPELSRHDRLSLFFVSHSTRGAVLDTARKLSCKLNLAWSGQASQPPTWLFESMRTLRNEPPLEAASSWLKVMGPAHAAGLPIHLHLAFHAKADSMYPRAPASPCVSDLCQHVLSQVGASVQELSITCADAVNFSTDHLVAIAQHAPHMRQLTIPSSCPPLPSATNFPALRQLNVPHSPSAATLASISPYLPQLTHLTLPTFTLPQLTTLLSTTPAPAAPNLNHLTTTMPMSDDLMQLLTTHTPQLHHLGVSTLPEQPLQRPPPSTLRSVTFSGLPRYCPARQHRLCAIHHVPEIITELHWELEGPEDLYLYGDQVGQCPAILAAVKRLSAITTHSVCSLLCLIVCGFSGNNQAGHPLTQPGHAHPLAQLLQVAMAFPYVDSLTLRDAHPAPADMEVLSSTWRKLSARRIVYALPLRTLCHGQQGWVWERLSEACEEVRVESDEDLRALGAKQLRAELANVRAFLDGTPRDRTEADPLTVGVQVKGRVAWHQSQAVEDALTPGKASDFPNVEFSCRDSGEYGCCRERCSECLEHQHEHERSRHGHYDDDSDDDYYCEEYDYIP